MDEPGIISAKQDVGFHFGGFHNLMPHRIQDLLLVSSPYESFILEEEGLLAELITSEYLHMNLSHAPRVSRVSTGQRALEIIKNESVDLVIAMTRLGGLSVTDFAQAVKETRPMLPVVVLAGEPRELFGPRGSGPGDSERGSILHRGCIDKIFVWNGNPRMLLAIIKFVEDMLNAEHDTRVGDVRVIILVENSIRFYSAYLPLIYTEVVNLTQSLMSEGLNNMHRLLRLRARPKILLAETFEEAWELYVKFSHNLLGVISDIRFPRNGTLDPEAGLEFTRRIRRDSPFLPVLLQSSDGSFAEAAEKLQTRFLNKTSRGLLRGLRSFMLTSMGFGDFVFMLSDGTEVGRAQDLQSLEQELTHIPDESLAFHAQHNHLSNWLLARTEFALAAMLRPRKVSDFESLDELRSYLINTLADFRERSRGGLIADFSRKRFDKTTTFTRIGNGSIGGKARGLAFINALIRHHNLSYRYDAVRITVPHSAAVGTAVFEAFLDKNNLKGLVTDDLDDQQIAQAFLEAKLPSDIHDDLRAFLKLIRYPLAVRSSSLLEDAHDHPFAGVYATYMIPNNHADLNIRLEQLCAAIKLVYASTFMTMAKRYLEATGRHAEEEEMGVILQELVGSAHGDRFYPTFSGVARSYNFYPTARMTPEDGVACVALGLGKTVVDGGQSLTFSPAHPNVLPQFPTTKDLLANSQRDFYALDISQPDVHPTVDTDANLVKCGLDVAEGDGMLAPIGSVYSPENDTVYDGIFRPGVRVVTFAHLLKSDLFPLAKILSKLLVLGSEGMSCPVEIEFAVDMSVKPAKFGFLQIRPAISDEEAQTVRIEDVDDDNVICYSPQAMGNGRVAGIRDIVYVKPDSFDSSFTREIAGEIAAINESLRRAEAPCLLIGFGRWGSADRWLGIPVTWDQICMARVIVETSLEDFQITPSQGTHFFQNLTSLGVGYFTVNPSVNEGSIDWEWLGKQEVVKETRFLRHLRLNGPLTVKIDGRYRRGIIIKPSE